jgi:hypothetical protein
MLTTFHNGRKTSLSEGRLGGAGITMQLYPARKMFRLLLPLYFAVFSVMPLSNIHIEGMQDRSSYLHGKPRQGADLHVLLHEMLFTHFGKRSEHLTNSVAARFIKNKEAYSKDHLRFTSSVEPALSPHFFDGERLITQDGVQNTQDFLCFEFPGLSPPAA